MLVFWGKCGKPEIGSRYIYGNMYHQAGYKVCVNLVFCAPAGKIVPKKTAKCTWYKMMILQPGTKSKILKLVQKQALKLRPVVFLDIW